MLKQELLNLLSAKTELSKNKINEVILALEEVVIEELVSGNEINIGKLGTFKPKDRAERKGVNPKTGEKITIPAKKTAVFKVSKKVTSLLK